MESGEFTARMHEVAERHESGDTLESLLDEPWLQLADRERIRRNLEVLHST